MREVFLELVEEFKNLVPVKSILELFNISKSSYYRWKQSSSKTGLSANEQIVIRLCKDTNLNYGYRKITGILKRDGHSIGKNTVQRIMQRFNLQCRVKPKRQKIYKGKESLLANNVLDRNFKTERPLEKLAIDIAYLPWGEAHLYLSSIMDLYDGQIIAYTIGNVQDIEFVSDTLHQLPELIHPCTMQMDQGSVYTSKAYQALLKKKSITISMSRKGNCLDNSPMENFFGLLKQEMYYGEKYKSIKELERDLREYIGWYNNERIKSKLKGFSPVQYRQESMHLNY